MCKHMDIANVVSSLRVKGEENPFKFLRGCDDVNGYHFFKKTDVATTGHTCELSKRKLEKGYEKILLL